MRTRANGHLRLDPKNARRHPERNQKMIADSLAELGAGRSILVDAGDTIIAGNGVYEQAQKLGIKVKVIESDGRLKMAQSLQQQHPDVVKITRKWGRWQHQVDYRPFKANRLIRKEGIEIPKGVNNYGMVLKRVTNGNGKAR